jgi:5-methylthioadenosine/S-adenosylhomocysteine deaminase
MPREQRSTQAREVDAIIHAKWLIPMTETGLILRDHCLVIQQQLIREILPSAEVGKVYRSKEIYRLDEHVLIPGLINAHGHAAMTMLRGYADDLELKPWLEDRIWPAEGRWVNEEFVRDGTELALAEMLLAGTTAFTDMYFFPDFAAKAALKANMRAHLASPVLDFPTVWAKDPDEYIHKAMSLHDQYKNNEHITVGFGPHATYTVSDKPMQTLATYASELDIAIHMHVHETANEVQEAVQKNGTRPLRHLEELGLLIPNLQCVHMTQLEADEISLLADRGASVVHCPASNMKLASGLCPVTALLEAGVTVALGTDGCASNNELNMLNEMRLAALLGKIASGDAASPSAWDVLKMATVNGAELMGLSEQIGTLESGKYADITAINLDRINSTPVYDPVSTLVYSTQSSQVSHVWVAGQLNVKNGELLSLDIQHLQDKAKHWAEKIEAN